MSKKSRKNKENQVAQQAAPVEKTEETVAANEAAPPKKDNRTKDQRRSDRLALKTKARSEALEQGLPWDDNFKAIMFEEDYKNAFKLATESPTAIDAEILKASDAKIASMSISALVATNDSTEQQPEPEQETPAEEPTTDTPAEETPIVEAVEDPYLRREGESKNQWKMRIKALDAEAKSAAKAAKAAEQAAETETRNGDAPTETKRYPTGELVYNSDEDGQSLEVKDAKDSANVFEAAAMGATDESATDTPNEERVEPPETNTPAEVESTEQPAETSTVVEAAPVEAPVEQKRETLKLVPKSNIKPIGDNSKGYIADAKKFYGAAYTEERAADLTDAYRLLCMAIRTEANGGQMADAALRNALKKEAEAFAIGVEQAKAA